MGVFAFCVSREIQQLQQRVDVRFTIHKDQTLHAIRSLFRIRYEYLHRCLFRVLFLHDLRPHGQIILTSKTYNIL